MDAFLSPHWPYTHSFIVIYFLVAIGAAHSHHGSMIKGNLETGDRQDPQVCSTWSWGHCPTAPPACMPSPWASVYPSWLCHLLCWFSKFIAINKTFLLHHHYLAERHRMATNALKPIVSFSFLDGNGPVQRKWGFLFFHYSVTVMFTIMTTLHKSKNFCLFLFPCATPLAVGSKAQ